LVLATRHTGRDGFLVLQLSARHPSAATRTQTAAPFVSGAHFLAQGNDTIFLSRARVVLANLAVGPAIASECAGEEESEFEHNPPCIEFGEAPQVLELPLDRLVTRLAIHDVPPTEYNVLQLEIHRPSPDRDTQFVHDNPEFATASIRVEGTYSQGEQRRDFVFASRFGEREIQRLIPPVSVAAGDTTHMTIRVDVASWFRSSDGSALIDPVSGNPGGANELLIRDHIRTSLKSFRDDNADGLDDDNEHY
jgi:hypothetical protein